MKAGVLLAAAALAAGAVDAGDARACSCVGPRLAFLSPLGADAAPVNVHVRLEAPTGGFRASSLVLRAHGGANVATSVHTYPGRMVTIVELVPAAPLPATTRFEVATVDPAAHPPVTVIGTFKTGTAADTKAPTLRGIGRPRTRLNTRYGGGDCSIRGPWIVLEGVDARDDRPDGKLVYGVWAPDAAGRLDTHRAPDTLVFPYQNRITIGQASQCDMRTFPFKGQVVTLAVAAIDESGNTSRAVQFRADLRHNTP
jgi:hypothetical protein